MKQIALDIGLAPGPSLRNFLAGPNAAALHHLQLWVGNDRRSPVPTYVWGEAGSGKTHLLRGVQAALREQGCPSGWMDASQLEHSVFHEGWRVVLLDDVHLYTAVQQQAAFNWFVNATTHPMVSSVGCSLQARFLRVIWAYGKICAPGWDGDIFISCKCSVRPSVGRYCDNKRTNVVFF